MLVIGCAVAAFAAVPDAATEVAGAAPAAPYQVQDLGTLPGDYGSTAMGINQAGDVVGWSTGPNGTRAFLYTDQAGMQALPAPAGRPVTSARAVNASRTVVGTASPGGSDIGRAARWRAGAALDLGTLGTGSFSEALGVNTAGTIVGSSYANGGGLAGGIHAFRYDDATGMVDLTPTADTARAEGINDAGQIAGYRESRAFRLDGTTFLDLGVPTGFAGSFGSAINASGQVAGHVITGSGNAERIFRYTDGAGMVILGGVGELNRAMGINRSGDVVGWGNPGGSFRQGFLYTDAAGLRGLNSLIDPASGWFVLGASGINDAGQIAGWASGPSGQHAVRLVPTGTVVPPTPPAAPSRLTAKVRTATQVRLAWIDNAGNEVRFRIQRAVGQGAFSLLARVGADVTHYTDGSVTPGRTFRYRVRAETSDAASAWSNTATVTS